MKEVRFSYDTVSIVRLALQMFIDKHNEHEQDKAKRMASNEVAYHLLADEDIENLLDKWSELNNGKATLFKDGLEDAGQMWNILWESEKFKSSFEKHVCKGYSGSGVYDKVSQKFYPCNFSQHYDTIKLILERSYPDLWKKHQAFVQEETKDCSEVDDFILSKLVLIENRYQTDYYTVSERKY